MKTNYFTASSSAPLCKAVTFLLLFCCVAAFGQCPTPPGNPANYGSGSWIGYVYSGLDSNNPPQNAFAGSMTYRGYITQTEQFNYDLVNASISGGSVCGSYADNFAVRFRMQKNFTPGYYTFTIGGDDGVRLSLDGGASWAISDWNYHTYQTSTNTFYLSGNTNLVLETYDQGGQFRVSFAYTACTAYSTAPMSISGNTAVCAGDATTLTATGGSLATGGTYQWGTGATVGNNIMAGQTSASITVSPTANTTYWVRRYDPAPCNQYTTGVTQAVTVTPVSTAPTSISGVTSLCSGNSTTLTASGGTLATGSVYEWGTGAVVGSNPIAGETSASITVSPSVTTTYWVRRVNGGNCSRTSGIITTVNVTVPGGDQVSFGNNSWIGYVYTSIDAANPPVNAFGTTYRGFLTQPEQFDQNLGSASLSGSDICGSYPTNFAIRFKMTKTFAAGYYTFTVGGDDGYRLSLDGGATWIVSNWNDHGYATSNTANLYFDGGSATNLVIEYYERGGVSQVSFSYTACTDISTAPTGISGTTLICRGSSTTLTATGGYAGSNVSYQWGTGSTVGNNILAGQTSASITVSPNNTATYWVRRVDGAPCNLTTGGVTQTVTVSVPSSAPTSISGTTTICSGSTTLTANGGTLAAGGSYEWGTGTVGSNVIAGQTSVSISVSPTITTTYWVRRVDVAPCNNPTAAVTKTVTVNPSSTAPTSISGTSSLCNTDAGVTLTANGGTAAAGSSYQWGTGSTVGNNIIAGQTNQTYYVNPATTTVYWVRRFDPSCNAYTGGVTVTVYKGSTGPYSISGAYMICANSSTVLTAQGGTPGTGSVYQWGTGNVGGQNIINGATAATITVTPTATTTYWVRLVDQGSCPGTSAVFYTLNTYTAPTAVTSISGISLLCSGSGGTTLHANGGSLGSNGQYQWGTGTVGTNIVGNNSNNYYINPTATTTYWVRTYDPTCGTYTNGVTYTVTVNTPSTQPGSISGTTTVCNGGSTTLTAVGGTAGTGSVYAWGTGYTVGQNVIAGATSASITVSPAVQTVYWVRRVDPAPCNTQTQGPTVVVNVAAASTAPISISGAPATSACSGSSYTLTATGGTAASGSTYQWGTGAVGSNIIAGQTGVSISVSPTATTSYWVRRYDGTPCSAYTSAATTTITITTPPGTPSSFGVNQWNAYGYSTGDINLTTAVYAGYYVQTTTSFDTQNGTNSWNNQASPSSSAGWNGCPVPADNFTFVYKRHGFPCGTYTIGLANWDDQVRVFVDGVLVFSCDNWNGGGGCNNGAISGSFNLNSSSEIEIRVREYGGGANLKFDMSRTDVASTAPTSLSGGTVSCSGAAVTLTASGGVSGTNGVFQWGTGTIGSNVIAGETSASITVTPATTTIYWVRRKDNLCGLTTAAVTTTVTVSGSTVAGILTSPSTVICRNATPQAITLSGQTGSVVKWQYAHDAAFISGVTDIASTNTTLTPAEIGPIPSTRYFRAVVQNGSCSVAYTNPVVITILAAVTYNGTWSGVPTALTPVVISANLNLTSNITACSCQVTNSAVLTVQPQVTLIVDREIVVDQGSNIIVESSGSIVQIQDIASNIGMATVKRNSSPMKNFDYTYWSSPVQSQTLYNLSPLTRFDKYMSFNPVTNNWVIHMNGAQVMEPGRGYIVRAPLDWSLTNASQGIYPGSFAGVPNSGVIAAPFAKGTGSYNLIGNPYPSAIDIDQFLTDPANENLVKGTIYLWTHNTAVSASIPGNAQYNYTADDYAKYNLTGGVKTANPAITGGEEPTGKVASGQAFFIEANTALANGTYTATFRNAMRVASQNGQFFRPAAGQSSPASVSGLEKHRIWLNIHNATGAYDEMLVGYVENATDGMDRLFDGEVFNGGNYVSLYSMIGATKLAIQGRALPFAATDVVPLGYKSSVAGTFVISLEHFDGLFDSQNVYLLDKTDMSYHDLKQADYSFTTATGVFNSRFEIHYQDPTLLGVGDPLANDNSVYIVKVDRHIEVSSGNYNMADVQLFDLTGKKVYETTDIHSTLFSTKDLNIAAQVLIVKVTLDNDQVITKKVIMY